MTELPHVPPFFRDVLHLRDVRELPMSDVACLLGVGIFAAKSRLQPARTELRSAAERCTPSASFSLPRRESWPIPPPRVSGWCPQAVALAVAAVWWCSPDVFQRLHPQLQIVVLPLPQHDGADCSRGVAGSVHLW